MQSSEQKVESPIILHDRGETGYKFTYISTLQLDNKVLRKVGNGIFTC